MSQTTPDSWKKLAASWVGIAPRNDLFDSWMSLNLNPPIEGRFPKGWEDRIKADPRALAYVRRHLRSSLNWESTWVDWSPSNEISVLLLSPKEVIERAVVLAGAICCRPLISKTIAKADRLSIVEVLGPAVVQRLSSRLSISRLNPPIAARFSEWGGDIPAALKRSGLLCLRIALRTHARDIEPRLAALLPDPLWKFSAPEFSPGEPEAAADCLKAALHLDQAA